MKKYLFVCCLALLPWQVLALDFSRDFAVVFADAETEARYGKIPLDRALLAQAVERAADAGAKGVVLKFFLDLPRSPSSDRRLAAALARLPVALQARIDDAEANPNALPDRFAVAQQSATPVAGERGWIPLPEFSAQAHSVCFVDFNAAPVPLFEKYRNRVVKSLLLCAAEMAVGRTASITPGQAVALGGQRLALDAFDRVQVDTRGDAAIPSLALHDLIEGKVAAGALKGKVVVIAYDGPNIHTFKTSSGEVGAHRWFVLMLRSFYEQLGH